MEGLFGKKGRGEGNTAAPGSILLSRAGEYQDDAAHQRNGAEDRRQRNAFVLFRRGLNRSQLHHFFSGVIRDALIGEREDRKRDQNDADNSRRLHATSSSFPQPCLSSAQTRGARPRPAIRLTRNSTMKTTKRIHAICEAAPAMPVKPRTPAIKAITRKVTAQLSI